MPNSPLVGISAFTQQMTQTRELTLAHTSNATIVTTSANRSPSATAPANTTASGRLVIRSEGTNYLKVIPIWQNQTGGVTITSAAIKVTGWHYDGNALWVPIPIADISATPNTYSAFALAQVSGSPNMNLTTAFVLNAGDAKFYQSHTTGLNGGAFCIDTWGASLIEIEFRAASVASAPVANCWFVSI